VALGRGLFLPDANPRMAKAGTRTFIAYMVTEKMLEARSRCQLNCRIEKIYGLQRNWTRSGSSRSKSRSRFSRLLGGACRASREMRPGSKRNLDCWVKALQKWVGFGGGSQPCGYVPLSSLVVSLFVCFFLSFLSFRVCLQDAGME
jgi:hypothetical protein